MANRESPLAVGDDDRFVAHAATGFHPERPERIAAARRGLVRVDVRRHVVPACAATREQLVRVHDERYIDRLESALRGGSGYLDGDTFFGPGTRDATWYSAGAACALVDTLIDDAAQHAVLLSRPPGHHATADRAMGFCLVNHVAVAAAHARARGIERVAIVDWDVHHGNGTETIFSRDPSVLYVSLHQWPLYPGTGTASYVGDGDGRGYNVNVPLPPGSGGAAYAAAFERVVLPVLTAARPELILVSAGYDAHVRDPLANMQLTDGDFAWMSWQLRAVAEQAGHGRVALFLEGGYDLAALEDSVQASVAALCTATSAPTTPTGALARDAERALAEAVRVQKDYWRGSV